MNREDFEKSRENLYREILKQLNAISCDTIVQGSIRARESCLTLVRLYKEYNSLVDNFTKEQTNHKQPPN